MEVRQIGAGHDERLVVQARGQLPSRSLGIDLAKLDIIVLKSRVHFWRGFVEDGLAKTVVVIDAPDLLKRARINPHKVGLLRAAAYVAADS